MSKKHLWKKRTVRGLIRHANLGSVKSQFELARNYQLGRYVEEDKNQSALYDEQVLAVVGDFKLRLNQLDLYQFRQFDKITVNFDSQVTILIGNNGSGKSSILDAISKSLIWLPANIINENTNCSLPSESDVNINKHTQYTYIDCQYGVLQNETFQHIFSKSKKGFKSHVESEHEQIKLLGDIYRFADNEIDDFNLPLVAYYAIDRSDEIKNRDFKSADSKSDELTWVKLDGYKDALKNPQNFANFLSWFIRLDKAKSQSKVPLSRIKQLNKELLDIQKESESADKSLLKYLDKNRIQKQSELNDLEYELSGSQSLKCAAIIDDVVKAIRIFIPEIKKVEIDYTSNIVDMKIDKIGEVISASQLSQGEKSLMALVGDLARRLTMLNPSRDNPLNGDGIVLIDEIDLHLHPSWQQKIIHKLTSTFKNIQFILTTHSPQVLSTVYSSKIRVLGKNNLEENVAAMPHAETYAHPNSDVMESVMQVKSIPNVPELVELNKYRKLVEQGDLKSGEIKKSLDVLHIQLEKLLGKDHPEMIKLSMVRRRRELLG